MKLTTMLTAAAIAVTGIAPIAAAPAAAAPVAQRTVVTERTVVRHDDRRWHRGPRWRHRAHTRRVCNWQWRHHHRVRVCRTVRW